MNAYVAHPTFFQTVQNRAHAVRTAKSVRWARRRGADGWQEEGAKRAQGVKFASKRRALQSPARPPAARQVLGSCQLLWSVASRLQKTVVYWFEPDHNLIRFLSQQSFDFFKIRVHIQTLREILRGLD
jgi:hypothetical protein